MKQRSVVPSLLRPGSPVRRRFKFLISALIASSLSSWVRGLPKPGMEGGQTATLSSQGRCVSSQGIPLDHFENNEVRYACLKDANVLRHCDTDGRLARLAAFRQWEKSLITFQDQCQMMGGTFSFEDPMFKEPSEESFCSAAEPVVQYDSFEQALCNFVSHCPSVKVICQVPSLPSESVTSSKNVQLPGIPHSIPVAY